MYKDVVVAYFHVLSWICLEALSKTTNELRIDSPRAEIWTTQNLPNMKQ
jgi:hypothetical protein